MKSFRNFLKRQYYELVLGMTTIILLGLLIICLVLAMISVTSGISQTIGAPRGEEKATMFDLDAAAALNLD